MDKKYIIEPEVAGQLGDSTILDGSSHPPIIERLHFIFSDWLGDDLIECFPVFLVSGQAKVVFEATKLSVFVFQDCEIEIS